MWRNMYNGVKVLDIYLKETSEIPNRLPTGVGGYVTKESVEVVTKKGLLEEALKNIMKKKAGEAQGKEGK